MGEIAEMMLDGTLCEGCGEYLGGEGNGFPRYCSRECAESRGAADIALTRKQKADRAVDRGELVSFKPTDFPAQMHKPWRCKCGRRFRLESGARQHFNQVHGGDRG